MEECVFHASAASVARLDGASVCAGCAMRGVEAKVKAAVERHGMFERGQRVGVALSGGKDSLVLLHITARLKPALGIESLVAITVDEGIKGYRDEAMELARRAASMLHVEHRLVGFRELWGSTLDDAVSLGRVPNPCSTCGVLRRRALDMAARTEGCDVLATGHSMDDNAETILMNILRGEPQRLLRTGAKTAMLEGYVPRVKPLAYLTEREVVLYAYLVGVDFQAEPCPYRGGALRLDILKSLARLEKWYPDARRNLVRAYEMYEKQGGASAKQMLRVCELCGYPSTSTVCKPCQEARRLQGIP